MKEYIQLGREYGRAKLLVRVLVVVDVAMMSELWVFWEHCPWN
jgi:hypothetical protein